MNGPLRFGLVGCGRIGALADDRAAGWPPELRELWLPYAHASAIAATPRARLVAVCDASEAAAAAAAARFRAERTYTDHRRMLEHERLDAVAIATRTAERPGIVLDAIAADVRAIYCEKPLASTLEEADAIGEAARRRRVAFGYGTRRRHMDVYTRARELCREGAIGALKLVVVRFGAGGLMWNHPHSVDIASFFAGDPGIRSVQGTLELPEGAPTELVADRTLDCDPVLVSGALEFSNGVRAAILPVDGQDVELVGTTGILTVRQDGRELILRTLATDRTDIGWMLTEQPIEGRPAASGTRRGIERLIAEVEVPSSDDELRAALEGHEAIFGLAESHFAGGARVSLPLRRRRIRITGRVGDKLC